MHSEKILERVIELFSVVTDAEEINEESELFEDLDVSSIDALTVLVSLEEEFGIKITEKAIRKVVTVGDLADMVTELME